LPEDDILISKHVATNNLIVFNILTIMCLKVIIMLYCSRNTLEYFVVRFTACIKPRDGIMNTAMHSATTYGPKKARIILPYMTHMWIHLSGTWSFRCNCIIIVTTDFVFSFLQWEELMKIGHEVPDVQLNNVLKTIGVNECCSLVYTVSIIHYNILTC
jgi:hypothetical protein